MTLYLVDGCLRSANPFLVCIDPVTESHRIRKDELLVVDGFFQIQDPSQSYRCGCLSIGHTHDYSLQRFGAS